MNHPKVLHVGFNPIGSPTNTGLTLGSMFGAWPDSRLFELYIISRQGLARKQSNVLFAPPFIAPIDGLLRKAVGSRIPAPVPDGMNNSVRGRSESLPLRYRLRAAATTLNEVGPVWARGRWAEPVEGFQPQVIHSLLGGVRVAKLVARLAERLHLPVVPHFMDDWPANMFADGQLLGIPRVEVERSIRSVMRHAPLCLTIGSDMRDEFEERFSLPCHVVGNSVSFEDFAYPLRPRDGLIRLAYVGGLHLGRDQVLAHVAEALDKSPAESQLIVYSPDADKRRVDALQQRFPRVVHPREAVQWQQVPRVLGEADVLVFAESLEPRIFSFTRLSVSTKVPEYLAARRPILALGPEGQSSIRALRQGPATAFDAGVEPTGVAQAVARAIRMAGQEIPGVSLQLLETFDRHRTQERLRSALSVATGLGV